MQLTDQWTLLMFIILLVEAVLALFTRKKREDEDEDDPDPDRDPAPRSAEAGI